MNALRTLPGPRELPIIGSAPDFIRDPLEFLERMARVHGDVARFRLPGQTIYLFSHPSAIEQFLVQHKDHVRKDKLTRELALLLGNGLLISEGAYWRKQRKLAQPGFHRDRIAAYGDVMVRFADRAISKWQDGQVRDIHKDMMRLTLDVVAKTLFGVEIGDTSRKLEAALQVLLHRFSGIGAVIPIVLPTPGNIRARKAIAQLDEITYGIIRERRRTGDNGDLISMLIAATSEEDDSKMDDVQLRDEAITLLLAGHETTALTLGFALHLLGEHPEAADKLVREANDVLGDRAPTAADLPKLRWAEAVVRESMRLYPPAWAVGRETTAPLEIGGWKVPSGTQVWGAQWVVHRDSRWFENPNSFRPERWDNDFAKSLPRYAYFPFGGGSRVCIGNAFAMMEAVLILVTIARRFRTTRASDRPLELMTSVTLRPRGGLPMTVSAR
jgi:cytochrome P450